MQGRSFDEAYKWLVAGGIALGMTLLMLIFLDILACSLPTPVKASDSKHAILLSKPLSKKTAPVLLTKSVRMPEPKRMNRKTKNRPRPRMAPDINLLSSVAVRTDDASAFQAKLGRLPIHMGDFTGRKIFSTGDLDSPLVTLARMQPVYPISAKKCRIQGFVTVRFVVTSTGEVDRISIVKADPTDIFDHCVRKCVSKWRFRPGTVGGVPVNTWAETTIMFELKNG
jgi:periplasmic protein TonB